MEMFQPFVGCLLESVDWKEVRKSEERDFDSFYGSASVVHSNPSSSGTCNKDSFYSRTSFVPISPGKQWITEDGISQVKGAISEGTLTSISGPDISGTIWIKMDETVDLNTGEGSLHGKRTITAIDRTFEGSVVGVITPTGPTTSYLSGKSVGHGAGDYEGQKIMGSFEGEVTMGVYPIELNMEGIILSPKGG